MQTIRFRSEQIKKAFDLRGNIKKTTKVGSTIYLNVTGILENNNFFSIEKRGEEFVLVPVNIDELLNK